jgi:hypothetical protein
MNRIKTLPRETNGGESTAVRTDAHRNPFGLRLSWHWQIAPFRLPIPVAQTSFSVEERNPVGTIQFKEV